MTFKFRNYFRIAVYFLSFTLIAIIFLKQSNHQTKDNIYLPKYKTKLIKNYTIPDIKILKDLRKEWIQKKMDRLSGAIKKERIQKIEESVEINYKIHAFYYTWFTNIKEDGKFSHWTVGMEFPSVIEESRTAFYPELGMYSSKNSTIIDIHMSQLVKAGIGVAIVSWYPPGHEDSPEEIITKLFEIADKYAIKIALHLRPYPGRDITSVSNDIKLFLAKYSEHNALFKMEKGDAMLPVFYVYDPYDIESSSWRKILEPGTDSSIRNTKLDGIFLAMLGDFQHRLEIKKAKFDGFYTYFSSNGYTYGSSWKNWATMRKFAQENGLMFVPTVGPGYYEGPSPTYNRHRLNGNYYEVGWKIAIESKPDIISINSFNAWEEGSQIEPAIPKRVNEFKFQDYDKLDPYFYLEFTGTWVINANKRLWL